MTSSAPSRTVTPISGALKHLIVAIPLFCLSLACCAQEFSLQDAKENTTGPFALKIVTDLASVKYCVRGGVVTVLPLDAPEGDLFIRRYTVMPTVIERIGCNTRENLDLIKRLVTEEICVTPREIQIDAQFVAFDLTNINRLVTSGPGISTASLMALWTNNCGELLAAPTVVTKAGQEAVVKGVTEVIYPTAFSCVGTAPANSTNTNVASATNNVEPGAFQTRETGAIFQIVPEVSAEGQMINLTFNPQFIDDPIWEDFGPANRDATGKDHPSQLRQPYFHVYSTMTSVSVYPGHRVLVGGGMPSRDHKRVVYLFVTATLIDPKGEAIKIRDDSEEPDQPVK